MDQKRVRGKDAEVSAEELEALTGLKVRRPDASALSARADTAPVPPLRGHRTRRARRLAQRRRPSALVVAAGAVLIIAAVAATGVLLVARLR